MNGPLRYANGFRIPQSSRLYQLSDKNIEFTLDPETTNTYELGYKQKSKKHSFQTALYYMSIADTITSYGTGSNRYYDNGETTHHYGIETTLKNKYSQTWASKISHAYSRHMFDDKEPNFSDKEMEAAPHTIASVQLLMTPQSIKGLKVKAEVQSTSSYYMDNANTRKYEGYEVTHLTAFYKMNKSWKFMARVSNLFDEVYAEKGSFSYGKERYTPAGPREIMISATYKW